MVNPYFTISYHFFKETDLDPLLSCRQARVFTRTWLYCPLPMVIPFYYSFLTHTYNIEAAMISNYSEYMDLYLSSQLCRSFLISAPTSTFGWWLAFFISDQNAVYYTSDERNQDGKIVTRELTIAEYKQCAQFTNFNKITILKRLFFRKSWQRI
ncbi:unnamed protein product [Haemonchus placei]|uniref:Uncharacterized protein n=1 Tax=Haemonchus placei TaxID=6290 RepID=A0A0N4WI76_HAEPC|nr:unnamed protein product [Haemonchus placei]